jgi:hypothetical protein
MRVELVSFHYAEYWSPLSMALSDQHNVLFILDSANGQYELSSPLREAISKGPRFAGFPASDGSMHRLIGKAAVDAAKVPTGVIHVQEVYKCIPTWANDVLRYSIPLVLTAHGPLTHSGPFNRRAAAVVPCRARLRAHADCLIVHGDDCGASGAKESPTSVSALRRYRTGFLVAGSQQLSRTHQRSYSSGASNPKKGSNFSSRPEGYSCKGDLSPA